jgi:23S rRNA (uracil1939-C5)-methyltransferase
LSFLAAEKGKVVRGIEIVADAVADAKVNAGLNNILDRSDFFAGKAEDLLAQGVIDASCFIGDDIVILDPPREGLHPSVLGFLKTLSETYTFRICYISCNPVTLARDLEGLAEAGWKFESIQPVDMFPHTHHIENIVVLTK